MGGVTPRLWRRKKKTVGVKTATQNLTVEDMISQLKTAKKTYRKAKKKHEQLRGTFLNNLKPKERNRLKRREAQRDLAYASKKVTGKLESKGVTRVEDEGRV